MSIVFPRQLAKINRSHWDAMYATTYDGASISMQNVLHDQRGAGGIGTFERGLHIRMMTRSSAGSRASFMMWQCHIRDDLNSMYNSHNRILIQTVRM